MGELKNFQLQLHSNQNATPNQQPIRLISYHTRVKLADEIKCLQHLSITEKVSIPTSWINSNVTVQVNTAIIQQCHAIPSNNEILIELHAAIIFLKLDQRERYNQL